MIELFSGIGSQTQALKNIGIDHEIIGISEINKYAIKVYEMLHGKVNNLGDITKIESLPYCDLLTYSFPCQDLSIAGKQAGIKEGTRSGLLFEVERLLNGMTKKPKYLLLENVKNLISEKFYNSYQDWLNKLTAFGYVNYSMLLNAKDYGIPQNRERVFCVSIRNDINKFFWIPEKQKLEIKLCDFLKNKVDKKYYLSEKLKIGLFQNAKVKGRIITDIVNCLTSRYYKDGKENLIIVDDIFKNRNSRFYAEYSPTLRAGKCKELKVIDLIYSEIRRLIPLECFRLMGFKDDQFNKITGISDTQLYKMAGNSIVVNVLEKIFINLLR
jgi:DNA (cytosine-5)-methyltransferase 1